MDVPVEVQLMRDWQPRSRPTRGVYRLGVGGHAPDLVKLTPGAVAIGHEMMLVSFENASRVGLSWVTARVGLSIDGTYIGEPRPAMWHLGASGVFSGVVHFPVVAGNDNLMFKGHHSLLLRTPE